MNLVRLVSEGKERLCRDQKRARNNYDRNEKEVIHFLFSVWIRPSVRTGSSFASLCGSHDRLQPTYVIQYRRDKVQRGIENGIRSDLFVELVAEFV